MKNIIFIKSFTWGLLVSVVFMLGVNRVFAHAEPVQTYPAAGATLTEAPKQVRIIFSEKILAPTTIKVLDKNNKQIDNKDGKIDPTDANSFTYVVTLPALPDGTYSVEWRSLSIDGHTESGKYGFTLKLAPVAQATATPTPAPTATVANPTATSAAIVSPTSPPISTMPPAPTLAVATPATVATVAVYTPINETNVMPNLFLLLIGVGSLGVLGVAVWLIRH